MPNTQSEHTARNLSALTQSERNAVVELAKLIRERLGSVVREIILFGSKAKGEGGRYSDIDILIVLTDVSWEKKKTISELAAQENIKYDVLISTVRYDARTWDNPVIQSSPFALAVKSEGVWL